MELDQSKIESIEKRSIYFQEILEKIPSKLIRWGNTVLLVFFALLLFGLWFINYPDVVNAEVKVIPQNPSLIVRSLNSGYVDRIFKNDKEQVLKGDWIMVLNNTSDYRDAQQLNKIIRSLEKGNFLESIDTLNLGTFEGLGDMSDFYYSFKRNVEELNLFKKLNQEFDQISVNNNRQLNIKSISNTISNQLVLIEKEKELTHNNLIRYQELYEKGIVSKLQLEQKEIEYLNKSKELERIKSSKYNANLDLSNIQKENLSIGEDKSKRYFELRNNILNSFNELLTKFNEWKRINVLESPADGLISLFDIRNENQFLTLEQEVFTVTPEELGNFYGYLKIPLTNSGKIKKGQKVIIKLNDYPHNEYGVLNGVIINLSKVPLKSFYNAKVQLVDGLVTSSGYNLDERFELFGNAEIITQSKSLLERTVSLLKNSNN